MMACSTTSNVIHFYSMRTGARLNFSVFGFQSVITSLALHETRTHVIIGLQNGSVISKFIRTNKTSLEFGGHSGPVKWLFTTPLNLLSSSTDNTIRYFQLWSGVCLLYVDLSREFSVSSVLLTTSPYSICVVGTKEGVLPMIDVDKKIYIRKPKVHSGEITALAQKENLLITVGKSGQIRVWDLTELENELNELNPYYEISVADGALSIFLYFYQIFIGCRNGIVQIVSLANGKPFKSVQIGRRVPILGLAVNEDKFGVRLIIWHKEGIEMRSFPLEKFPPKKRSTEKNDTESKQKAPRKATKSKFFEMLSRNAL